MTDSEQREAARQFTNKWRKGGDEKQDCHPFWTGLLRNVLGVEEVEEYIQFEKPVKLPEGDGKIHTRYIDGYIPAVKVLIEQKGSKHSLNEKEPQSGGEIKETYIAIPKVSSQNRRYIPMDYLPGEIIPGDKLFTMPDATLYHFGVLESNVHMAWTRAVCGRLKSDYSYSNTIVYNNFPWPTPTSEQKSKIEQTAQAILDARALYPDSSLADLYDPLTMPPELRKAHTSNDIAVMKAYGFSTEGGCTVRSVKGGRSNWWESSLSKA